ncbi:MAG: hypothetical protein Q8L77_08750 [Nitrospirota bacterium]|nr:hypothetical protein [Nitrospirota bacterium]
MNDSVECPICRMRCNDARHLGAKDVTEYDCPRCGNYSITHQAVLNIENSEMSKQDRAKVAAYLRERTLRGDLRIRILSQQFPDMEFDTPVATISEIIKDHFPRTVSERLDRALKNIHRLSEHLGDGIDLDLEIDGPVLFAEHKDSFDFIADTLQEAGWVKLNPVFGTHGIVLTARGLERIAELERNIVGKESKQAFVAMWFDSSLAKVWEDGFEKSCDAAGGYKALRMDLTEHNQKICDAIIAEIRKSRFVVADFTGHRGGVYFEAGYALGLGIPVIWTCREDELEKTHFDTRQYNHVVWKDEKDLFVKLKRRIEATISA